MLFPSPTTIISFVWLLSLLYSLHKWRSAQGRPDGRVTWITVTCASTCRRVHLHDIQRSIVRQAAGCFSAAARRPRCPSMRLKLKLVCALQAACIWGRTTSIRFEATSPGRRPYARAFQMEEDVWERRCWRVRFYISPQHDTVDGHARTTLSEFVCGNSESFWWWKRSRRSKSLFICAGLTGAELALSLFAFMRVKAWQSDLMSHLVLTQNTDNTKTWRIRQQDTTQQQQSIKSAQKSTRSETGVSNSLAWLTFLNSPSSGRLMANRQNSVIGKIVHCWELLLLPSRDVSLLFAVFLVLLVYSFFFCSFDSCRGIG